MKKKNEGHQRRRRALDYIDIVVDGNLPAILVASCRRDQEKGWKLILVFMIRWFG